MFALWRVRVLPAQTRKHKHAHIKHSQARVSRFIFIASITCASPRDTPPPPFLVRTSDTHIRTIPTPTYTNRASTQTGVFEVLECFFDNKPIRQEYLIAQDGKLAGVGAHSYTQGNATKGHEEAAKYKAANA